jgi:transcriptional regulator with XRE-family HTH domain
MESSMIVSATQLHPIGRVAEAAGVSTQTVRIWERRGLIHSTRTKGGHRVFTFDMLRRAVELASASRRAREQQLAGTASQQSLELASTGMRIRRARLAKRLSQQDAAQQAGISRSFLAAVERGESGCSVQVLSRLADTFGIPMSRFAPSPAAAGRVTRVSDRPRTVLADGVTWEELAPPGSHDIEPALLYMPPGQGSGGPVVRPGEDFLLILKGELVFYLGEHQEEVRLETGDAMVVDGGTPIAWRNPGRKTATCLWVELITTLRKKRTAGKR